MNNTFKNAFIFALGGAVGAFVTWKLLESKCEARIQAEVDSVKRAFQERYTQTSVDDENENLENDEEEDTTEEVDLPDIKEYAEKLKNSGYVPYSTVEEDEDVKSQTAIDRPYVISPEEFAEFEEYEHITLFYYTDGYLADRNDELVDGVDDTVGVESLSAFGQYEDDAVHVRNDARKCDYEILRSMKAYSDVIKTNSHLHVED